MLFGILLTIQIIVSVSMAGLILIQRSEGGALGMGGNAGGFMSARGAGNLLTRATAILAFIFFANSIGLTIAGNYSQRSVSAVDKVDTSGLTVNTSAQPDTPTTPVQQAPTSAAPSLSDLPLQGAAPASAPAAGIKPAAAPASKAAAPVSKAPVSKAPVSKAPAPSSSASATSSSAAQ